MVTRVNTRPGLGATTTVGGRPWMDLSPDSNISPFDPRFRPGGVLSDTPGALNPELRPGGVLSGNVSPFDPATRPGGLLDSVPLVTNQNGTVTAPGGSNIGGGVSGGSGGGGSSGFIPPQALQYNGATVYLPGVKGQMTSLQGALNRLALGGSPYEALSGLLSPEDRMAQQGNGGYTGVNAQFSGASGATPINTGLPSGYSGIPSTGGNLPGVPGGNLPSTGGNLPPAPPVPGSFNAGPMQKVRPPQGDPNMPRGTRNNSPEFEALKDNFMNMKRTYGVGSPEAQLANQALSLEKFGLLSERRSPNQPTLTGPAALTPEQQAMLASQMAMLPVDTGDATRGWTTKDTRRSDPLFQGRKDAQKYLQWAQDFGTPQQTIDAYRLWNEASDAYRATKR